MTTTKQSKPLRWSHNLAAAETGHARETIRRGLIQLGIEPGKDGKYSTRDIIAAISSDLKNERAREARARANLLELEVKQKRGELLPGDEVRDLINKANIPPWERTKAMPSALAHKVNPPDPDHARPILARWVKEMGEVWRESIIKVTNKKRCR